jgi:hypothetical protein
MMAALAEIDDKVDGNAAAGAQRNVGNRPALARSVECDEHIGGAKVVMLAEERRQSGGAGLLAGLDHDLGVEAESAAFSHNGAQGLEGEQMRALVIDHAAAVDAVALDACADQHRTVDGIGIVENLGGETHLRDHRSANVAAIAFQFRLA